jgi:hypothetical protein
MNKHGVSAPRAVRAMLGDLTALHGGHEKKTQDDNQLLESAVPVSFDVWDDLPEGRGTNRPGYVMNVVKNFIFEMEVGDCILVKPFYDRKGNRVRAATMAACLCQIYKPGTFSVITRGLQNGEYIIRRNA